MIKGLYAAASAMIANMDRQKTLAHNAANLETTGFKEIITSMNDFLVTDVTFSPGNIAHTNRLTNLGWTGVGSEPGEEVTCFDSGGIKYTGEPLDLAINGEGFFTVQTPEGDVRYTRDGRFIRDSENNLVSVDGNFILDTNGQKITLPEGTVTLRFDGTLQVDGEEAAQIGLAGFENVAEELERAGDNLFSAAGEPSSTAVGEVQQGYLEMSNVNVSHLTTQMVMVARSYEAAQKMVTQQDQLLGTVINKLGQV